MEVHQNTQMSKNKRRGKNKKKNRNNNRGGQNTGNNCGGNSNSKTAHPGSINGGMASNGNQRQKLNGNSKQGSPHKTPPASDKTLELDHLIEMFGKEIEEEVITICWESSNKDYEQTIMALSCMISQKENEKPEASHPPKEEPKEEKKKSKFGLSSGSRTFVPGKGRTEKEEKKVKDEEEEKIQEEKKEEEEAGDPGAIRTNNPFMDAFNNFSYREPDEEEMKESKKIADSYMEYQEKEEKEWFIEQEKELLQSLIKDCQLDEYLGEGVLDEETLKMIYETSDSSPTASQASTNPSEDSKQDFPIIATKKNKGRRNRKKKTPEKLPPEMPVNNDKPFDETNIAEEAVDFANDASLQFLINQQILAEQEQKMLSEYQYNQSEFPSLVAGDDLKQIKRKKAFAINEWTKTKSGQSSTGCGDDLEEEQIKKIKKAFPAINTDI